jgi:hypothetical protein
MSPTFHEQVRTGKGIINSLLFPDSVRDIFIMLKDRSFFISGETQELNLTLLTTIWRFVSSAALFAMKGESVVASVLVLTQERNKEGQGLSFFGIDGD